MATKADLNTNEIEAKLSELDQRITALRVSYEQYFVGVERKPPNQQRQDLVRLLHELEHKTFIQNTAQKFKLRSLVQRFQTYKIYWDRILKQIEEGTYKRDLNKVQRKQTRREQQQAQQEAFELDFDMDAVDSLDDFAQELHQMDQKGAFNYAAKAPQPQPQQQYSPQPSAAGGADQDLRAQRIMELQRKLGLPATGEPAQPSAPTPQRAQPQAPATPAPVAANVQETEAQREEQRRAKLEEMKRRLAARTESNTAHANPAAAATSAAGALPTAGANAEQLQRLRADKERLLKERAARALGRSNAAPAAPQPASNRVIERQGGASQVDPQVQRVYRNLVEAKRRCNETTNNLTYEAVARSMDQQRERFRSSHGSNDVDFKVVIKDGKAFLKPEPK